MCQLEATDAHRPRAAAARARSVVTVTTSGSRSKWGQARPCPILSFQSPCSDPTWPRGAGQPSGPQSAAPNWPLPPYTGQATGRSSHLQTTSQGQTLGHQTGHWLGVLAPPQPSIPAHQAHITYCQAPVDIPGRKGSQARGLWRVCAGSFRRAPRAWQAPRRWRDVCFGHCLMCPITTAWRQTSRELEKVHKRQGGRICNRVSPGDSRSVCGVRCAVGVAWEGRGNTEGLPQEARQGCEGDSIPACQRSDSTCF